MSYPPGPQNPYGQPQQPQQPQQPPQQPQYGYPQQQSPYGYGAGGYPAYPAYPGQPGYPMGMPQQMPGMLKAARIILFVFAGLQVIAGLFMFVGAAAISKNSTDSSIGSGVLMGAAVLVLILAAIEITLGVRFSKGAGGVRIGTIIYASLILLGGIGNVVRGTSGVISAVIAFALGGFLLAAMLQSDSSAWFNRQR
jgi:hypothetical protein